MADTEGPITNGVHKDPNGLLPGTTFPESSKNHQNGAQSQEDAISFDGPTVNGRPTTTTFFKPLQLRDSPLLPSLYSMINRAFNQGHMHNGVQILPGLRLRSDVQFFEELGTEPGSFTYIIHYTGSDDVVGTASAKRYLGRMLVVDQVDDRESRRAATWRRFGPVPHEAAAWELSTMAVDPDVHKQGIASYLMKLVEDEMRSQYQTILEEAADDEKPTRLMTLITTIKERHFDFYSRRSFVIDEEKRYEQGWLDSRTDFTVLKMSKVVET